MNINESYPYRATGGKSEHHASDAETHRLEADEVDLWFWNTFYQCPLQSDRIQNIRKRDDIEFHVFRVFGWPWHEVFKSPQTFDVGSFWREETRNCHHWNNWRLGFRYASTCDSSVHPSETHQQSRLQIIGRWTGLLWLSITKFLIQDMY